MIDDLIVSPQYWAVFAVAMAAFFWGLRYTLLDFKFFIALFISQYIAHLYVLIDQYSSLFLFALLSGLMIILGRSTVPKILRTQTKQLTFIDYEARNYLVLCKLFIVTYFLLRFALYPQFFSEFDISARLEAQYDNRVIYIFSLVIGVPVAAVLCDWIDRRELGRFDKFLAVLIFLGYLQSGSKGTVIFLALAFIGLTSYMQRRVSPVYVAGGLLSVFAIAWTALKIFFPQLNSQEIGQLILHRIVSNTDNIEFLYVLGAQPGDYPYAGIGELFAPIAKRFGEQIDYPIGVWLFGSRFGDWSGFGPNSGFIIEFFGSLGYGGLLVAFFVGVAIGYCEQRRTLYRAVLLSMLHLILIENQIFTTSLLAHSFFILLARAASFLPKRPKSNNTRKILVWR